LAAENYLLVSGCLDINYCECAAPVCASLLRVDSTFILVRERSLP
jgi:hypothetical protein